MTYDKRAPDLDAPLTPSSASEQDRQPHRAIRGAEAAERRAPSPAERRDGDRLASRSHGKIRRQTDSLIPRKPDGQLRRKPDAQTARKPDAQTARKPDGQAQRRPDGRTVAAIAGVGILGALSVPWAFAPGADASVTASQPLAPAPAVGLSVTAGPALAGDPVTLTLAATNLFAAGPMGTIERTLVMSDVLPPGVSYQAGSTLPATIGEPTATVNDPATGWTTLQWPNAGDVAAASRITLSYSVTSTGGVGSSFADKASVTATTVSPATEQRRRVVVTPVGASSSTTVALQPFAVTETDSGAATTGLVTDTVTVTSSAATTGAAVGVDVYLPAGVVLEPCPVVATVPAATVPAAAAPVTTTGPTCQPPNTGASDGLTLSPGGSTPAVPLTAGTVPFTGLHWALPDLAAGATETFNYVVRVPITAPAPAPTDLVIATATVSPVAPNPPVTPDASTPGVTPGTSNPPVAQEAPALAASSSAAAAAPAVAPAPSPVATEDVIHIFPEPPPPPAPTVAATTPPSPPLPNPSIPLLPSSLTTIANTASNNTVRAAATGSATRSPFSAGSSTTPAQPVGAAPIGTPAMSTGRNPFAIPGATATPTTGNAAATAGTAPTSPALPTAIGSGGAGSSTLSGTPLPTTGTDALRSLAVAFCASIAGAALVGVSRPRRQKLHRQAQTS